jgi:S-adenosylmethionine synthetase
VQVAYAIGVAKPVSVFVDTKGTGKLSDKKLSEIIQKEVDLTPNGIIERLNLRTPIYGKTSAYGHFGRKEKTFTWEQLDLVPVFKKYLKK